MQNTPSIDASPPELWSEVRAHARVMRYQCSGVGSPILLLGLNGGEHGAWPELTDALMTQFRLIVPEVPADVDVAGWSTEFLEGLGIAGVSVLAANRSCLPALELVLRDVDQVARLVLVTDGAADETVGDGALTTAARAASVPLLVVRRGNTDTETVSVVAHFLGGKNGVSE